MKANYPVADVNTQQSCEYLIAKVGVVLEVQSDDFRFNFKL